MVYGLGLCLKVGLVLPMGLGCREILTDFCSDGNDLCEVSFVHVGTKTARPRKVHKRFAAYDRVQEWRFTSRNTGSTNANPVFAGCS